MSKKLKISTVLEWVDLVKSGQVPSNIPRYPAAYYQDKGWEGWRNWLGTEYGPFEEAREFVRSLGLKNEREWREYLKSGKKPDHITPSPEFIYKDCGWEGWGDFLGTNNKSYNPNKYSFEEAREMARGLGLKSARQWGEYVKNSQDTRLTYSPGVTYKNNGWISWEDWLGKDDFKPLSFAEARALARTLKLTNMADWNRYRTGRNNICIPTYPHKYYKDSGWIGWEDFLGDTYIPYNDFLPFEEALEFVSKLGFKSQKEWKEYAKSDKKPANIPASPSHVYKDKGWQGIQHWLGNAPLDFEKARKYARNLNLESKKEWKDFNRSGKRPINIPPNPSFVYKNKGWLGWKDWLGTSTETFEKAKAFVHTLNLKSAREWDAYCQSGKRPGHIPSQPSKVYRDEGWAGWGDWLGTGNVKNGNQDWLPFEEARKITRKLGLKSNQEWRDYCKSGNKPQNIPSAPPYIYKDKWVDWMDWLDYTPQKPPSKFLPFEEAKQYARRQNLHSAREWEEHCKKNRPDNIPFKPARTYKDKGWINWMDWLGTNNRQHYRRAKTARKQEEIWVV